MLVYCHCRSQKFEDPAEGEAALVAKFQQLHEDLTNGFRNLEDETRQLKIASLLKFCVIPIVRGILVSRGSSAPSVLLFECLIHSYHICSFVGAGLAFDVVVCLAIFMSFHHSVFFSLKNKRRNMPFRYVFMRIKLFQNMKCRLAYGFWIHRLEFVGDMDFLNPVFHRWIQPCSDAYLKDLTCKTLQTIKFGIFDISFPQNP